MLMRSYMNNNASYARRRRSIERPTVVLTSSRYYDITFIWAHNIILANNIDK